MPDEDASRSAQLEGKRGYRSIEIMSSFNQAVFSQMDPKYFQLLKSHCIVFTIMWSDTEEGLNHRYFTLYHYCSFFWEKHVNILLDMMRAHRIGHI